MIGTELAKDRDEIERDPGIDNYRVEKDPGIERGLGIERDPGIPGIERIPG